MPQAWQAREIQRQGLLEKLVKETFEKEDESKSESFLLDLAVAVLKSLKICQRGGCWLGGISEEEDFFFKEILPAIRRFSRIEAETNFLVAEFFKKILNPGLLPFYRELMGQEISDPEKVYGVSSAAAEVSLAEDDSK